ncbi:uncharacterized protein CEXT_650391 [Caerostris extrusa]|uniref:Uncharacterized protein n=1 Tax=Caerostris extrusa TaxID=172846 RepID=A0AAV4N180_CAEEX|nr:uncharacterized protein CEXT_650391 [Caerostris extrusa]
MEGCEVGAVRQRGAVQDVTSKSNTFPVSMESTATQPFKEVCPLRLPCSSTETPHSSRLKSFCNFLAALHIESSATSIATFKRPFSAFWVEEKLKNHTSKVKWEHSPYFESSNKQMLLLKHLGHESSESTLLNVAMSIILFQLMNLKQDSGCFYHGCPICYDPDSVHPLKGISMATVKEKTDKTSAVLRSKGFQVVELWEHEFKEQKRNPQLQKF